MTQQEIHDAVEDAHRHDWQVGIHANGDVTIDMVLKAYERVLKQVAASRPPASHRALHAGESGAHRAASRRPAPSRRRSGPTSTIHGEKWSQYGDEKMRWMFAHRSFLDAGIPVPGASDYGPGPFEPLMAIQSMVTRRDYRGREWGPNQKVTRRRGAAHRDAATARTRRTRRTSKGSITAGQARRLRDAREGSARRRSRHDQGHHGRADRGRRPDRASEGVTRARLHGPYNEGALRPAILAAAHA